MIDKGKFNLLGVNIDAVDYEGAIHRIVTAAREGKAYGVSALAVHGVMTGAMDAVHRHRLNQLEMIVPDGQPVRWGLNILYRTKLAERVYGPDLMLKTCETAASTDIPIFLFGGTEALLDSLRTTLLEKCPGLNIAGSRASKFRCMDADERAALIEDIRNSGAAIMFVGLGCPRQEVWAYEFKNALGMPVLAVGAAFNFHAGVLDQAPPMLQRLGLEWLYRFSKEPTRLWKRYMLLNPMYVTLFLLQLLRLRRFDPSETTPPAEEVWYG